MEMERKSFPFELEEKGIDLETGTFAGYAAVCGNLDEGGDIIDYGAFRKTIAERGPDSPRNRLKVFKYHNFMAPIGKVVEIGEVPKGKMPKDIVANYPGVTGGLFVKGQISHTSDGDEVLTLMRDNVVDEMSIAYEVIKEAYESDEEEDVQLRHLKEIRLYSCDPVPLAMNPAAVVTDVKKQGLEPETKAVVSFQDLPLASEEREWDAGAAKKRVASWAGGPDKDDVDWGKYKKAFLYVVDDQADQFGGYKMPIADAIDGTLTAVPRGIFAAAGYLDRLDASDSDKEKIRNHLGRYYAKMDRDPPWKALAGAWDQYQKAVEEVCGRSQPSEDEMKEREQAYLEARMRELEIRKQAMGAG